MYNNSNVRPTNSYETASQTVSSAGTMGNRDIVAGLPMIPVHGTHGYHSLTNGGKSTSGYSTISTGYGSCQSGYKMRSHHPFSESPSPSPM
jgi:hypothetical protein